MLSDESPVSPSSHGIVLCLQLLVEEAAMLDLHQTSAALAHAMQLAAMEGELLDRMVPFRAPNEPMAASPGRH